MAGPEKKRNAGSLGVFSLEVFVRGVGRVTRALFRGYSPSLCPSLAMCWPSRDLHFDGSSSLKLAKK